MWGCVVFMTVHVLSVWLVTCVAGKDVTRSQHTLRTHWGRLNPAIEPFDFPCAPPNWVGSEFSVCGDGYCRCKDEFADCSGHYGALSYVPVLPDNILYLDFSDNKLQHIRLECGDFFQNVTNIVALDLGENGLSYISAGAFRSLENLRELGLWGNRLTYTTLAPALSVTSLEKLDLSIMPLGAPPDGLFHTYPLPHLHTLCLQYSQVTHLNMSVFKPLLNLSYLALSANALSRETMSPQILPQLTNLILNKNPFLSFPKTCIDVNSSMPNLKWLDLSLSPMMAFPTKSVCLPRLEKFTCTGCAIVIIPTNTFGEHLFPSLKVLFLSHSTHSGTIINAYAFNNTELERIIVDNNRIDFSTDSCHPDCFAGCPNLKGLYLDNNDLSSVSVQKLQRLFNNDHVSVLSLESTNIRHISADMFSNVPHAAYLRMGSNRLTDIPDGAFDRLEFLRLLDLSSNLISVVRETAFSPTSRQRLRHVDLGNNPFHCDCELRWFRHWLTTQPGSFRNCSLFGHPCTPYTCENLVNTTVQSFYVADQACLWSPAVSKFIIATVILLMLPLTAGAVIYRYRWHIRLVLYEAARGRGDRWRRLQEQDFRYDVFVCYDSEDLDWVRAHLMPELEERLGLKLCIHTRDFTPGAPIVENIEESVETSKKILMLFSKNFADSYWCQFELQLCLTHVLEHGDALLVVLLEDIPSRDLTPAMIAVMKTVTYIEWRDEPEARASFWGCIRLALNEILE